jgi:phenylpyruvate tautomerase PptA (4-oxalocrotonate tautomerase family)
VPILFIEASAGIGDDAKKKMVEKMTAALDEAWHVPDVRIFVREYGGILNVPNLRSVAAKRKVAEKLQTAFAEAYGGIANTAELLVFMNEYPLENAFSGGRLQSDNPQIVEGMKQLSGVGV